MIGIGTDRGTDAVSPSLAIGATPGMRYVEAWRIPTPRIGLRGAVTLCILSSNTWNLEGVYIADATPWATVTTLHHLLCGGANGVGVEHGRIDLPWGTRHHLCGLERWIAFATRSLPGPDSAAVSIGRRTRRARPARRAPASPRSGASGARSPDARPCLLVAGPVVIENVPRIRDVTALLEGLGQSRLFFVDSLIAMGARIVLCDPHRAVVVGPTELRGRYWTHGVVGGLGGINGGVWAPLLREVRMSGAPAAAAAVVTTAPLMNDRLFTSRPCVSST